MRGTKSILVGILTLSLTGNGCSYLGYQAGKSLDEQGSTTSFPMAMQALDGLAPDDRVELLLDNGTRIDGLFLELVPVDESVPDSEPLQGLGERVTITMRDGGRSHEGEIVGYDSKHVVVGTGGGEQSIRWSRVLDITTVTGEQLDIDGLQEDVQDRRMAQVSAVRVLQTNIGRESVKEVPLDSILSVGRPARKVFRWPGLFVGAFFDAMILLVLIYGVAGTIADANE